MSMKIQRVNKYYDFATMKNSYKKSVLRHKQEYGIATTKMQKYKPLECNPDFDELQFNAQKINKELCETLEKIMRSMHRAVLYYFV